MYGRICVGYMQILGHWEVTEVASVQTGLRTCRSQRAQFRFFFMTVAASQRPGFYPTLLRSFCISWKRVQSQHWFCVFQRLGILGFSWANWGKKVDLACAEPHCCGCNGSAERGKCPQMHDEQAVNGSLHHGGIILTNQGAPG